MVDERLTGYTVMIVRKVRLCGKTNSVHAMRMPHTPSMVSRAVILPDKGGAGLCLLACIRGDFACCPVLLVLFTDTHRGLGHFFSSPGLMPKLSRNAR